MDKKDKLFKTNLAKENWKSKYKYGSETPLETQIRVAKGLASVENESIRKEMEEKFLKTLVKFDKEGNAVGLKCTPGGRITANIGTDFKNATLFNCFINGPVTNAKLTYERKVPSTGQSIKCEIKTPETPDNLRNIMFTLLEQAETLKSEGGYGLNFDFIRPRGTIIKGIGLKHPGIIEYMKVWDQVATCIVKGDNDGYKDTLKNYLSEEDISKVYSKVKAMPRKGAMMGVLSVWHPDIEEFVKAKQEPGILTKFNISVLVNDEFMTAVKRDSYYNLQFGGVVYKRVKARELYDLIMKSTYNRAEPGILFGDNMNRLNPLSYMGLVNATNPCMTGDTRLLTEDGYIRLDELEQMDKNVKVPVFDLEDQQYKIVTPVKKTFITNESEKVYEVVCKDGSMFKATDYHKFPISMNKPGYKELKDMKVGDEIFTSINEMKIYGKEYFPDLAYLMGYVAGDGTYQKSDEKNSNYKEMVSISIHNKGMELCSIIEEKLSKIFPEVRDGVYGENIKFGKERSKKQNDKKYRVLNSRLLTDKLAEYGMTRDTKFNIPDKIFKADRETAFAYIQGLFDADGSHNVSQGNQNGVCIELTSTHIEMLREVKTLLSYLGMRSRIYQSHKEGMKMLPDGYGGKKEYFCKANFKLRIAGLSAKKFYEHGNFLTSYKAEAIENAVKNKKIWRDENLKTKIISITELKPETTYDLTVEKPDEMLLEYNGIHAQECGEIPGNPITSTTCLLGSINLTQYVDEDRSFDFNQYQTDVSMFARMLDNVSDISNLPLTQYKWAVDNLRQYGMGLNGFGSTLYMMGIPYNSAKAKEFAETLLISRENLTWITSALLAKEKGPFPGYNKKEFLNTEYYKTAKETYLWPKTIELIEKYGVRNAKTTTNPPLGNTSVVCDMVSNGLEPVFMHEYERTYIIKNWPEGLNTNNIKKLLNHEKIGDADIWKGEFKGEKYYYEPHNRGLCIIEPVRDYGYQWVLDNYPEDIKKNKKYLVTTEQLNVNDHVNMQEIFQKYCNQSVSKTINLPNSYPFEDFKNLYMSGWRKGLIGLTTYRDGSMEAVLSKVEEAKIEKRVVVEHVSLPDEFINGNTHKIRREGSKFYLHFSYLPNDTAKNWPIALFINCNSQYESIVCNRSAKVLKELAIDSGIPEHLVTNQFDKCKDDQPHRKLSKMISLNLRHGVEIVKIIESLKGVEGDNISSLLTAVRKFLSQNVDDGTIVEGTKCDKCGAENSLIYSSGCVVCKDCGYSGCN